MTLVLLFNEPQLYSRLSLSMRQGDYVLQAAAGDTPACTDALTRSVGALPVVAARAMAEGQDAMHALSSKLQVHCGRREAPVVAVVRRQQSLLPFHVACEPAQIIIWSHECSPAVAVCEYALCECDVVLPCRQLHGNTSVCPISSGGCGASYSLRIHR